MRFRLIAATVVVTSACQFAVPHQRAPAEPQQQAEAIDFDALRAQATAALTSLQRSREARVASVVTTASSLSQEPGQFDGHTPPM
jgi:hypothetical protein